MALPTMPGYWTNRKNIYEQAIVRRRNHESDFRQKWTDASDYFHKLDIDSTKKRAWTSDQSFQDSMEAYKATAEKDLKALNLKRRQMKLADLLQTENRKYEAELKGYSRDNYSRIEDMRDRAEELKSAREEKRKQLAEEKLYEHWRQNNPDLKKVESDLMQEYVIGGWSEQVEDKREKLESARREKQEYERQVEEERLMAVDLEKQKAQEKLKEEKRLKEILKEQMMELQQREAEAAMLKQQQEELERHQWEVEQMEKIRKAKEDARKKQDFGRILLRQHKAQMMRRSRQIQEELEQDRKVLESLIQKEKEDLVLHTARREKARADAAWMKQVIEEQIKVEKSREAELDMLYQDEAARMWQKREAEWEKEKRARERLMAEVLEARQDQIVDKMEELRLQQEESLERREELLREMEIANQLTRRDQEKAEADREALKLNLHEQVTSRKEQEYLALQRQKDELEEEKRAEKDYRDILRQETERMRLHGFTPREYGRKQAWN